MGEVVRVYLSCHTPRYCNFEAKDGRVDEPFRVVQQGLVAHGRDIAAARPDVLIVNTTHWVGTFTQFVDGTPRHQGVLTSPEHPDLIRQVPYDYPGDRDLAAAIIAKGEAAGLPCYLVDDPHLIGDYGTVMPVLCYWAPRQDIAVIPVATCLQSDLDEAYRWGELIAEAVRESDRRAAFIASGSVSHRQVRGPARWPTEADQALDHKLAELLAAGELARVRAWLPEWARRTHAEMGGRHLAMMLGVLSADRYAATLQGYGPSSGTGNYLITFAPAAVAA
jgi:3,4-dihydroxyphenylacetate 2,3-dioxygenase